MKNVIIPGAVGNIARHIIAYGRCDGLLCHRSIPNLLFGAKSNDLPGRHKRSGGRGCGNGKYIVTILCIELYILNESYGI